MFPGTSAARRGSQQKIKSHRHKHRQHCTAPVCLVVLGAAGPGGLAPPRFSPISFLVSAFVKLQLQLFLWQEHSLPTLPIKPFNK